MTGVRQVSSWILQVRRRAAIALLALGVISVPALVDGWPAQAPEAGPSYTVLYAFKGFTDGAFPVADPLIEDSSGNFYGVTLYGGDESCNPQIGCGAVYELNATGQETVLYSFSGGTDGAYPDGPLVRDASGNLYGTAPTGGATADCGGMGCGVVFKVSPTGQETPLYTFTGAADGANPVGGHIRDSSGNLYGTAGGGGAYGYGVVFKLSLTGRESVLYSFTGGTDGEYPGAGVIRDSSGNLYGTTSYGGLSNKCINGYSCGVVFEVSPTGQETVLYRFRNGSDGANPGGGLIRDSSGNLYGTTSFGGGTGCISRLGCGVVFEVSASGLESVLYRFTGAADGANPYGGLVGDSSGNLSGTTLYGGNSGPPYGPGVVFKLSRTRQETVLYAFTGGTDGGGPSGSLIRDASGNLYGTAGDGGEVSGCEFFGGCGVVFKLVP